MELINQLEYELIEETKCGKEELSVLIEAFSQEYGLENLIASLVKLVEEGFIDCFVGKDKKQNITKQELEAYIDKRLMMNEDLSEYPEVCEEYYFFATDKGISQLSDEDKPIV